MKNSKGQTVLEYVLLLGLIAGIFFGVYKQFKSFWEEDERADQLIGPFKALDKEKGYRKFKIIR